MRQWVAAVDLSASVPNTATEVLLSYKVEPEGGEAILYRARDDAEAIWLRGGEGQVRLRLMEPQRIYYEVIGPGTRLDVRVSGYS